MLSVLVACASSEFVLTQTSDEFLLETLDADRLSPTARVDFLPLPPTQTPESIQPPTAIPVPTASPSSAPRTSVETIPMEELVAIPNDWWILYEDNNPVVLQTTEGILYAGFIRISDRSEMQFVDGANVLIAGFDTDEQAAAAFENWDENYLLARFGEEITTADTVYEGNIRLITHQITETYDDAQLSGLAETYYLMHVCTLVVEYHFLEHSGKYPQATPHILPRAEHIEVALQTIRNVVNVVGCEGY